MGENILQHSCLKNLSAEALKLFEDKKTQVNYLKGETIIKQGAWATHIVFVNNGLAREYIQSEGHKQINLRLVKNGDFIAFFSIFDNNTHPYSVVALKDTTICMVDKNALTELMLNNPQFALEMTSRNYRRENRYMDIISSLSFKQMRGKMATALLYLSSDHFKEHDVFEHLTRQDIADFASVTIESAIKFIKEFEKENIVRLDGKKIMISNRHKLEEISRVG